MYMNDLNFKNNLEFGRLVFVVCLLLLLLLGRLNAAISN
jgi:hypothetical protein